MCIASDPGWSDSILVPLAEPLLYHLKVQAEQAVIMECSLMLTNKVIALITIQFNLLPG